MKLFCFSYAGGTADFYKEIKELLGERGIEVIALDYPGHGARRKEPFMADFYQLSLDMVSKIKEALKPDEQYALMGYSMGSITVTEVVRRILELRGIAEPVHIFLAAHEPKTLRALAGLTAETQDEVLKERTISFGAVPNELIGNKTFWRMYMPLYKADYTMIGKYDFEQLMLKTNISATLFYSESDTPRAEMERWKDYYVGEVGLYEFAGNHFFIKNHVREIADIICKSIQGKEKAGNQQ